jgi:hypothetical protein
LRAHKQPASLDNEVSGLNGGNPPYAAALQILDGDMSQYIHDNTDDELSHAAFLGNYLASKGAEPVDLTKFRVLPSSQATGANKTAGRLTSLTQLTIDTSFGPATEASQIRISIRTRRSFRQCRV